VRNTKIKSIEKGESYTKPEIRRAENIGYKETKRLERRKK
jgi:hypothetical protein